MNEVDETAADELAFRPSQERGSGRVDRGDPPFEIRDQHDVGGQAPHPVAVGRALGDLLLQREVQVRERLRGCLLLLDVGVGADPPGHLCLLVADRQRPRQVPAVLAIGTAQAKFGFIGVAVAQCASPARRRGGHVVRMDHGGPALAVELARARTAVVVNLLVEPVQHAIRRRCPDVIGHGLRKGAELRLAGSHGLLGPDLAAGLDHDGQHARGLATVVQQRRIVQVHPDLLRFPGAEQRHLLVPVRQRAAAETDLHDVVVEGRDLRPALAHPRAEQRGVPGAGEDRVGVVVDHDAARTPQHDHRDGRSQDQRDRRPQAARPAVQRPECGPGPVEPVDQTRQVSATVEESAGLAGFEGRHHGLFPRHGISGRCAQLRHCTRPLHAVASTTIPNAIRYQANGTKLWVEM